MVHAYDKDRLVRWRNAVTDTEQFIPFPSFDAHADRYDNTESLVAVHNLPFAITIERFFVRN